MTAEPVDDVDKVKRAFAEWGIEFRPAEIVSGSFGVVTDNFPRVHYGMEWTETIQTLAYDGVDVARQLRVSYEYRRRWMGDYWGDPVKARERV